MTKHYLGTPEQAMAFAEMQSRAWHQAEVEANKMRDVDNALEHFLYKVDDVNRLLADGDLQQAIDQEFTRLQKALDVLRTKVYAELRTAVAQ